MNISVPGKQSVWSQLVQAPSRSENDAQEAILLSSIQQQQQPGDHSQRIQRTRKTRDGSDSSSAIETTASSNSSPLKPFFQLRPLSLDRGAIAPCLARPTAPFAKTKRKKATVSAIYYSECFLRNIRPIDADSAAFDIQNQYTKWWVQSKKQPSRSISISNQNDDTDANDNYKRRRLDPETTDGGSIPPSLVAPPESKSPLMTQDQLTLLKTRTVEHLQKTGGDTTTAEFQNCLEQLRSVYACRKTGDANTSRDDPAECIDGTWLALSKPTFSECQGRNENGEYMYSLGRMSFDMFRPTQLKCSIRAIMNNIRVMDPKHKPQSFPRRLGKELQRHNKATAMSPTDNPIRHYDIVVAFTIEANQTRLGTDPGSSSKDEFVVPRPIRGLMMNHGYLVADPRDSNRSSIWFSGGSIEAQDEVADGEIWKQIFDESLAPRRDMRAMANVLAAKLLLGAYTTTSCADSVTATSRESRSDSEGRQECDDSVPTMSYIFKRPIGGHGEVFCDALYVDETLRIMQGHRGSIFVFTRVPPFRM